MNRSPTRSRGIGALLLVGLSACTGDGWGLQDPAPQATLPMPAARTTAPSPLRLGDNLWTRSNLTLPDLDGVDHRLDEWRDRLLLINFWASWCGPCQYEIPDLVALQKQHAAAGLQILGIGLDEPRPLHNVARTLGINYPVLVADDVDGQRLLELFGNADRLVPYSVVIADDGTLVYTHLGEINQEVFDEFISPLLTTP